MIFELLAIILFALWLLSFVAVLLNDYTKLQKYALSILYVFALILIAASFEIIIVR